VNDAFDNRERLQWERDCLDRARRGDRAAFAELYQAFAADLFRRVLMPRLGNRQAAEDALAETFRTLLERLDDYEDQGKSVWHWLARIAINKATDMHRVKGRTSRALANFEGLLKPLEIGPSDPASEFALRIESDHVKRAVVGVLDRLNPRYRRAIELRFLEDRSREDCAKELDVKIGTFDVLLLRALRSFRKEWETVTAERKSEP
jgi:RNA polymerase sigma-70 factor (ECF subfamily)